LKSYSDAESNVASAFGSLARWRKLHLVPLVPAKEEPFELVEPALRSPFIRRIIIAIAYEETEAKDLRFLIVEFITQLYLGYVCLTGLLYKSSPESDELESA
jgi:hypothetical protein